MVMRVCCFLLVLAVPSVVIAQQTPPGPSPETQSTTSVGWLLFWGALAAASLFVCARFGLLGRGGLQRPTAPQRRWHPLVYLLVCIAALMLQIVAFTIVGGVAVGAGLIEEAPAQVAADAAAPAADVVDAPARDPATEAAAERELSLRAQAVLTAGSQTLTLLALIAVLRLLRQRLGPALASVEVDGKRRRPGWGRVVAWGLLGLALTFPFAQFAGLVGGWVQTVTTGRAPEQLSHTTLQQLAAARPEEAAWVALLVLTVVIVVPIFEELTYRLGLQGSIASASGSRWLGIAATALLFAVMHWGAVPPAALAPLVVLGIGFGAVYERTGSLAAAVVMHAGFNALNVAALLVI
jgi:hypothetical protein